jgi:uncharacterized alkaline shock family protein YloU
MLEAGNRSDLGTLKLHHDVLASIAVLAAKEVPGVVDLKSNILGRVFRLLGRKGFYQGVKIIPQQKDAKVELYIVVEYGRHIPAVAKEVQENVSKKIEEMTGLYNIEVLVNVQGVTLSEKK